MVDLLTHVTLSENGLLMYSLSIQIIRIKGLLNFYHWAESEEREIL